MANIYANYAQTVTFTPQSAPIPGREPEMEPNNAGGFGFKLDDWERLTRFLILGSDGGTYYVGEQKLTAQNAAVVIRCIKADGTRVVSEALDVNLRNRAPKTDPQLFVLALALKHGDAETKFRCAIALEAVLRTGTHVLHFAAMLDSLGGWSRAKRRVIADWLCGDSDRVAYQALKYQSRDGWSMRDLLRVAHPKAPTDAHRAVFDWICGRDVAGRPELPTVLGNYRAMQTIIAMDGTPVPGTLFGISHGLPREALPTEALAEPEVWRALLPHTPPHALLRNLGNITEKGLTDPDAELVASRLADHDALRKARVHPFAVLLATLVYKQGHGVRGKKTWVPARRILDALEDAYDAAFDNVTPTGKRILIGIDVSASMSRSCIGTPIPASTAAAAMAITLARAEPNATVVMFDTQVRGVVPITKRTGIASLDNATGGGTDLTASVRWALGTATIRPLPAVDAFIVLTDNETWAGHGHCAEWLRQYRRKVNQRAKLVCCAMAANHASVVDPADPLSFGCAGLDANLPSLVTEFIGR